MVCIYSKVFFVQGDPILLLGFDEKYHQLYYGGGSIINIIFIQVEGGQAISRNGMF